MKKYIDFELLRKLPKTAVYNVLSRSSGDVLGTIYWHWAWRQYIFEPRPVTIWSRGCLQEIQDFINRLMDERKKK